MPAPDHRKAVRDAIAKALYDTRNIGFDIDTIIDAALKAINDTPLHVVNLEVMENGVFRDGYTSLHRTPEGAAKRLYQRANEWGVDIENNPEVSAAVWTLPIED